MLSLRYLAATPILFLCVGCSRVVENVPEGRIELLEKQVEQQRQESNDAVEAYALMVAGKLDDLNVSVAEILRQLPGTGRHASLPHSAPRPSPCSGRGPHQARSARILAGGYGSARNRRQTW